jgi:hypothetical protein
MNRTLCFNSTAGLDPIPTGWSFSYQQRRTNSLEAKLEHNNLRGLLNWLLLDHHNKYNRDKVRSTCHHLFPCSVSGIKLPMALHFMALPTDPTKLFRWKFPLWGGGLKMFNHHKMLTIRTLLDCNRYRLETIKMHNRIISSYQLSLPKNKSALRWNNI